MIERDSILMERAKIRAVRIAKVSTIRGDETEVSVAACWDEDTRSSMIQPSHAIPEEAFHAASVKIGPGPIPAGGCEGTLLTLSQPSLKSPNTRVFISEASGAKVHTFSA